MTRGLNLRSAWPLNDQASETRGGGDPAKFRGFPSIAQGSFTADAGILRISDGYAISAPDTLILTASGGEVIRAEQL